MSPNSPLFPLRTVVEQKYVSEKIEQARKIYPRLHEVVDALKWRLSRQPEAGVQIPDENPPKYILKSRDDFQDPEIPIVTLIYSYDSNTVTIEIIKFDSN